jgi:long-chain acyl-CoA synthetase
VPHPVLGEEPAAVVQIVGGASATEQTLKDHVRARLAGFKVPVKILLEGEPLPRNANGKIMKHVLKGRFAR